MSDLTRQTTFEAAWDKRSLDPKKNYGVHGVRIDFVLKGPAGAVYFPVLTKWYTPEVDDWHRALAEGNPSLLHATESVICPAYSIHSPREREGWDRQPENCEFLGTPCWLLSSGFSAPDAIWEKMLREGSEGFWAALEKIYREKLA